MLSFFVLVKLIWNVSMLLISRKTSISKQTLNTNDDDRKTSVSKQPIPILFQMRSTYLSIEKEEGEETSRSGVGRHAEALTKLKLMSLATYLTQTIQSTYNNDNNNDNDNRRLPHQIHLRL